MAVGIGGHGGLPLIARVIAEPRLGCERRHSRDARNHSRCRQEQQGNVPKGSARV